MTRLLEKKKILLGDSDFDPLPRWPKLEIKNFSFPGGEQHVQILDRNDGTTGVTVCAQLGKIPEVTLIQIALIADALQRSMPDVERTLFLSAFPGARQDRVCNEGEPHTARVVGDLLNYMKWDQVIIASPHSEVAAAVTNNSIVCDLDVALCRKVADKIKEFSRDTDKFSLETINVICPDAGAGKRVSKVASALAGAFPDKKINLIRCEKVRDVRDGSLKEFFVQADKLEDGHNIIFDDVVAYGGTFIGLLEVLKQKSNPEKSTYSIFTCHADCEEGLQKLGGAFDYVFTTNSRPHAIERTAKSNIFIEKITF